MSATPLLDIADLSIRFAAPRGHEAVVGVSFAMGRERLAIVGESGAGKSLIGRSILGLLPPGARASVTRLAFDGIDLQAPGAVRALRGRRIGLVLQDAKFALNPVMTIGAQIAEMFRRHRNASPRAAQALALDMLATVRLREPERVFTLYPHQLSGGMGQRALIAMMLAPEPDLLIADEPTSALDASARLEILALLDELITRRGMALLLISHDLDLVQGFCDRVLVMRDGQILERLVATELDRAQHPYTRRLLAARLSLAEPA